MELDLHESIADLNAKCLAFELVITDLIANAWPIDLHRLERERNLQDIITRSTAETDWSSEEHVQLERVRAELRVLFGSVGALEN